ncbi:LysR family transcriptional regulator [Mesorhizobium sp. M0701]|uniref:LysR family transcriptional regulator n=1 Tax=Mesorhizobium sp. M0701 TaxID=2956989 RepID=UPI00333AFEFE
MLLLSIIEESGSLKQAAQRVGMSQPRASKSVQEMEELMQQKLFVRSNRGVLPTEAGTCVIRHAKLMTYQISNLQEELGNIKDGTWTKLRIGTIMGAVPIVTESIRRFLRTHTSASFEILEDTSVELLRLLDQGALDLVVGRSSVSQNPALYEVSAFHDELLTVVANPRHPLVGKKAVELEDLIQSRWIVYTAAMPMRVSLEHEYRQAGLAFPRTLIETRSAFTTMTLIQCSPNYIALLSADVAGFFVNFGIAQILRLQLRSKSEPYEVITRRSAIPPNVVSDFIAELTSGGQQ